MAPDNKEVDISRGNANIAKDFEILKGIATSLIHENADIKNELDEKERELNLLYKVLREISYSMDWHEIQQTLLDIILEFFSVVSFCMIALFDQDGGGCRLRTRKRGNPTAESDFLALPFKIDETTSWDEVVASSEWSEYFHKFTTGPNMQTSFIPLKLKTRELGFLMIGKPAEVKYGKGEWRFLRTIANHLAITLENAELYLLASTDELTGLFNRRYFTDRLDRELDRAARRSEKLCLLMLDIDHFKAVNDNFGHQAGDEVLVQLSARLKNIIGERGTACRFGGEEFTVILLNTGGREGFAIAEELRKFNHERLFEFDSDGRQITATITISIGVASYPADAPEMGSLINKADQALYIAKAEGRNKVISHQRVEPEQ